MTIDRKGRHLGSQYTIWTLAYWKHQTSDKYINSTLIKQLLDEVEHDIMNYQNRGLCYLPKPKAEADNTDTRF